MDLLRGILWGLVVTCLFLILQTKVKLSKEAQFYSWIAIGSSIALGGM